MSAGTIESAAADADAAPAGRSRTRAGQVAVANGPTCPGMPRPMARR